MIPVKICGITNEYDAIAAVNFGASAIGFVFYKNSQRYLSLLEAKSISEKIDHKVNIVGVFVNHSKEFINHAIDLIPLSMIQLHGDESPEFCKNFSVPTIKAIRVKNKLRSETLDQYEVDCILLDSFSKTEYGGTGKTFDWSLIDFKFKQKILLSGGLNSENILEAISSINPDAIDISSSIESSIGQKDHYKMRQLFEVIKHTKGTGYTYG
tara:strand:- start:61 stop:693 length:633 start_codon:yes stop_codon:yes gene_type:complete